MLTSIQPGALVQWLRNGPKLLPVPQGVSPSSHPVWGTLPCIPSSQQMKKDLRLPLTPAMISNLYVCEIFG